MPIVISKIGDNEVNSVSARDLYLDLGMSKAHWSLWSKANILENEFLAQGIDFIPLTPDVSDKSKGNFAQDYAVTINTAKHIAMMAKTKRAHDYRNYFIECEKIAKGEVPKVEPKQESSLIENIKAASAVIDVTKKRANNGRSQKESNSPARHFPNSTHGKIITPNQYSFTTINKL